MPFGGVCFIGLILVPFTLTMSRNPSGTQNTQTILGALTGNSAVDTLAPLDASSS